MSKVEVNQVTQQCGTTLTVGGGACKTAVVDATTVTLGRCGGTVSLASGATQSGFGRTGTVDWITTPKVTGDSPVTGVTGKGYFLNTTAGTITINLPAGAAGSIVSMADYAGTWQTYNVTVTPNGSEKIGSVNTSVVLNTEGQSVTFVYVDSTQGWINTMDSTSNVRGNEFITATGGNSCGISGDYKWHKFTGPGTFAVSGIAANAPDNVISYMVVAGGGGATDGGGGGGGFREYKNSCDPYTASPLNGNPGGTAITLTATPYPIQVGGGGAGNTGPRTRGVPSTFSTITSTGGGLGVSTGGAPVISPEGPGGSGGGANPSGVSTGNTPPVTPAQGFNGGVGTCYGAAGGGGATAVGNNGNPGPRIGGAGATTSISATPTAYSGGGGGGAYSPYFPSPAPGGVGGGGLGSATSTPGATPGPSGPNGTDNTGGGGGGAWNGTNGNGGSGIVIIRYKFQ